MSSIAEVAARIEQLLGPVADRVAHETGWVRRRSKLSGAQLVRTLVLGWLQAPTASLGALSQTAAGLGVRISPQGLDQRFTPAAADCLAAVLDHAVQEVLAADPVAIPLLARFPAVAVQDSTTVGLPPALADVWAGCGGQHHPEDAALKLQVRLDLCTGQLSGLLREDGRAADQTTALQAAPLPRGALRLADLGYFSVPVLADLSQQGVYWLSRLQVQTAVYDGAGRRLDLQAWLAQGGGTTQDVPVQLGARQHLAARLLAGPVPATVAAARRRKLRAAARNAGRTVSKARLALAGWTLLVTNAPAELISVAEALVLYRARWQIELLFKLWKQHGHLDEWRTAKPGRILCEVYAKLVALVLQHWCLLVGCWAVPNRSWVQAAQTIRASAGLLISALAGLLTLTDALAYLARCLQTGCRLNPRRTHPTTYQLLLAPPPLPTLPQVA